MEVKPGEILHRGDIVLFKGGGFISNVLSFLLDLFDKDWRNLKMRFLTDGYFLNNVYLDGKPWHVGFISGWMDRSGYDVYYLTEAVAGGVRERLFTRYEKNIRIYRWLDAEPANEKMQEFLKEVKGCKYDVLCYFLTALQYLFRSLWNRPIPRLLDKAYTCWELVYEMADEMGKQMASPHDCPMISDMCRCLGILPSKAIEPKVLSIVKEKCAVDIP